MCIFVVKTWKFKELLSHFSAVFQGFRIAKFPNSLVRFQDFHGIATDHRIEPFSLESIHLQGTAIHLEKGSVIHMARSCKFTMKTKQNDILLDGFLEVLCSIDGFSTVLRSVVQGSCAATPRIVSAVVELPSPELLGSFPSLETSIPGAQSRICCMFYPQASKAQSRCRVERWVPKSTLRRIESAKKLG